MNIIQRATDITLKPSSEWEVIAPETTTTADLYKTYIVPLSAIPVVASFVGMTLIGMSIPFAGHIRTPLVAGLTTLVLGFIVSLVSTFVIAQIINALAQSFGGEKNSMQALKVTAYAFTPAWLAGVLNIIPMLGMLGIFASFYSIYVLYLGLPVLMKAPKDKALGYTIVSVICAIVLSFIMAAIVTSVVGLTTLSATNLNSFAKHETRDDAKLEEKTVAATVALKELSKLANKMEAAQKEGKEQATDGNTTDSTATVEAPAEAPQIEVLSAAKVKSLLPESIEGLKRVSISSEKSSGSGYEITKAQAQYSDGAAASITLSVGDYGSNVKSGFFTWVEGEQDNESEFGYEKTGVVDGRQTHETGLKNNTLSEYSVVIANRFVVESTGQNVSVDKLKAAINTVGLDNIEALKSEGVK
jgi:hypothetical protein